MNSYAAAHLGEQGMFFGKNIAPGVIRPLFAALVVHCGDGIFGQNAVAAHHAHLLEHQHSGASLGGGNGSSQSGCAGSHYGHIAVKRTKARRVCVSSGVGPHFARQQNRSGCGACSRCQQH